MAAQLAHEIRNPLGLHQRLGPGADAGAEHVRRAGAAPRHHHPRVAAALRRAQPVPVPGPAGGADAGAGGPRPRDRGGGDAAAQRARGGPRAPGRVRGRRGAARLHGGPRPDRCRSSGTWPATGWRPCLPAGACGSRLVPPGQRGGAGRVRRGPRDRQRGPAAALRALPLRRRHGHRPRPGHRLPHRPAAPGRHPRAQHARQGHRGRGAPAAGPRPRLRREEPHPRRRRRALDARDARHHALQGGLRGPGGGEPRRRRPRSSPRARWTWSSRTSSCPTGTGSRSCAT